MCIGGRSNNALCGRYSGVMWSIICVSFCFRLNETLMTHAEATLSCTQSGGELARIDNKHKQECLRNMLEGNIITLITILKALSFRLTLHVQYKPKQSVRWSHHITYRDNCMKCNVPNQLIMILVVPYKFLINWLLVYYSCYVLTTTQPPKTIVLVSGICQ